MISISLSRLKSQAFQAWDFFCRAGRRRVQGRAVRGNRVLIVEDEIVEAMFLSDYWSFGVMSVASWRLPAGRRSRSQNAKKNREFSVSQFARRKLPFKRLVTSLTQEIRVALPDSVLRDILNAFQQTSIFLSSFLFTFTCSPEASTALTVVAE